MAISLFSISKNFLKNSLINKASIFLDEESTAVKSTIKAILTCLYAKFIDISESKKGLEELHELIISSHFNNLDYINLDDLFSGENSLLIDESNLFLSILYKDQLEPLYQLISKNYNIHKESSSALVKMIIPIVIGSVNKVLTTERLNSNGFYQLLNEQRRYLHHIDLPNSLVDKLIEDFDFKSLKEKRAFDLSREPNVTKKPKLNFKNIAASLVGFLVLGSAYYTSIRATDSPKKREVVRVENTEEIKKNTIDDLDILFSPTDKILGKYIKNYEFLGCFIEKNLSNGVKLIIPSNGSEIKIINFIESSELAGVSNWYSLRRIVPSKGTNLVSEKSTNQINNLIAILENYPNVHLTIGGYSYNQNDPIKNFEASYRFVEEVTKEILKSDINENRIRFEGYGDNYQVKQGPLESKRVSIRITKK